MQKIKTVLRLAGLGLSQRQQIALSCQVGQATVSDYLRMAAAAGIKWPDVADWDEDRLRTSLAPASIPAPNWRKAGDPDYAEIRRELQTHKHLTKRNPDETSSGAAPGSVKLIFMTFAEQYKAQLLTAIAAIDVEKVGRAIEILAQARNEGRRIFTCGNGGSASAASHFATDMVKGASFGRDKRFRVIALTDSLPTLTAYSNDVSYECVFVEQLKNFAEPGDVLLAISGSGNSPNVLRAVEYARSLGCRTIALSGRDGGKLGPLADLNLHAAHPHMGRIEDCHLIMLHMIGYYFMEEECTSLTAV